MRGTNVGTDGQGDGQGDGKGQRRKGLAGRAGRGVGAAALAAFAGGMLAAAGTSTGAAAATSATTVPHCGSGAPKLTVHGTGLATGTPNLLTLTLAVSVTGATAQTALSADNTSTSAVVSALTGGGVVSKDVQTTGLSVQPSYDKTGTLTGYAVSNSVVAKIHDFTTAGAVIDAAAGAAGNAVRIDSLAFSIQDPSGVQDQARQDAVHQAVSHAATMAAAAGERLGAVCSLTDDSSLSADSEEYGDAAAGAPSTGTSVPLQPGTQQASAQVTLVYALESSKQVTTRSR